MADDDLHLQDPPTPPPPAPDFDGKIDGLKTELVSALGNVASAVSAIDDRVRGLETPAPGDGEPDLGDLGDPKEAFQDLYADPDKKIGDVAVDRIRKEIAPTLLPLYEDKAVDNLREQEDAIVDQFGQDVWDKHFNPTLKEWQKDWGTEMRASRKHVSTAIQAIYGGLHQNEETRKVLEEARAKVAADATPVPQPAEFVSGHRIVPQDPTALSPEEKEFVDRLKASGIDTDESRYMAARNRGHTLEEWRASKKKEKTS